MTGSPVDSTASSTNASGEEKPRSLDNVPADRVIPNAGEGRVSLSVISVTAQAIDHKLPAEWKVDLDTFTGEVTAAGMLGRVSDQPLADILEFAGRDEGFAVVNRTTGIRTRARLLSYGGVKLTGNTLLDTVVLAKAMTRLGCLPLVVAPEAGPGARPVLAYGYNIGKELLLQCVDNGVTKVHQLASVCMAFYVGEVSVISS